MRVRRALFTVSDKTGIVELARAFVASGAEIVATGRTASVLKDAGLAVTPIEKITGTPEAFQGRMKTLSFQVCSGILYRRGDAQDEADLAKLGIPPIDAVVVNFYPFEEAAARVLEQTSPSATFAGERAGGLPPTNVAFGDVHGADSATRAGLVDEIDIGGPTLVRSAAKNAPSTLVLTDPGQYARVIEELGSGGQVSRETATACAARAWERVLAYDAAIAAVFGEGAARSSQNENFGASAGAELRLRYGENPHQTGVLSYAHDSPIAWDQRLTETELSYNNILDLSAAYALASDLTLLDPRAQGVVIVKHNNPCGVALAPSGTQLEALERAWEGDPVSAFGGVLVFTRPLEQATADWLASRFVELVAAPGLTREALAAVTAKRKNLKAVAVRRFGEVPRETLVSVPGGILRQSSDVGLGEKLRSVTRAAFPESRERLARFGIAVCRALKSNAIALVRELPGASMQLVGAGQGQPNRIEAL